MLNWVKIKRVGQPFYGLNTTPLKKVLYVIGVVYRRIILHKNLAWIVLRKQAMGKSLYI